MMTLNQYMMFNVYKKPEKQNVSRGEFVKTVASVGSFFSYINDARSHEPEVCSFNVEWFR